MKKVILLICVLVVCTAKSYSQADSSFHKVSVRLFANAVNLPLGNKYYGASYGIGGLGTAYHFNSKFSVELSFNYSTLPMIDPKDVVYMYTASMVPRHYPLNYSFTGGDLTMVTTALLFRYDFCRCTHFHMYANAGPTISFLHSDAITGYDVLIQSNPPVIEAQPVLNETAFGANLNVGGACYFGKHLNIFTEVGYKLMLTHTISSSALSYMPASVGLEYGL